MKNTITVKDYFKIFHTKDKNRTVKRFDTFGIITTVSNYRDGIPTKTVEIFMLSEAYAATLSDTEPFISAREHALNNSEYMIKIYDGGFTHTSSEEVWIYDGSWKDDFNKEVYQVEVDKIADKEAEALKEYKLTSLRKEKILLDYVKNKYARKGT